MGDSNFTLYYYPSDLAPLLHESPQGERKKEGLETVWVEWTEAGRQETPLKKARLLVWHDCTLIFRFYRTENKK